MYTEENVDLREDNKGVFLLFSLRWIWKGWCCGEISIVQFDNKWKSHHSSRKGDENNFFTKRQSLLLNTGALGYRATYLMNILKCSSMLLANYAPTRLLPVFQTIDVKFFQYVHNFAAFTTRNKFLRKISQKKRIVLEACARLNSKWTVPILMCENSNSFTPHANKGLNSKNCQK